MFTESRKIELLKDVLDTTNEETLVALERIVKAKRNIKTDRPLPSIYDFLGIISEKDGVKMKEAISLCH